MNETSILITLASVHFVALMSPGPDVALVIQNASRYGRQTGVYIALGLSCGILLHLLLSLTGVSYLVHQQPTLFAVLQLLGGSYLLYLGSGAMQSFWRQCRKPAAQTLLTGHGPALMLNNNREAFSKGFLTNLLNPKALVFFISLLSSLIPAGMSFTGKSLALVILWGLSLIWFASLAWLLSTARLQRKLQSLSLYIDGLCGIIFILISISILWQSISTLMPLS